MKRIITSLFLAALVATLSAHMSLSAQNKQLVELKTVVIDAGHGGHDPGATNGKIYEKNITLSVAKRLGELIRKNYPSINVIYTRSDDRFVELYKRADIANKNKGQDKNSENFEICRTENSVIVLEDDYSSNYQGFDPGNPESYIIFSLLQNSHLEQSTDFATLVQQYADAGPISNNRGVKQANFIVLWKCTMPAVLIELGFISNANDIRTLTDKTGQQHIAENIFKAFKAYKKSYDTEVIIPTSSAPDNITADKPNIQTTAPADGKFGIQILASRKLLPKDAPELKGWNCRYIKSGRTYKYYVGSYSTKDEAREALPKVRNSFPGAFIINIE